VLFVWKCQYCLRRVFGVGHCEQNDPTVYQPIATR
jgi:hypothetical protein